MDDFEDLPPEDFPRMLEAMSMLGALGGGAVPISQVLAGRPDLERRFRHLNPVTAAATFGGLLTVPDLQANGVRVEALVHLAVVLGGGEQKPSEKLVAEAFRFLGDGICGHMEDPAEDVLVGLVRSPWGNFRVLDGLWEGGTFYLQRFIDVLSGMPAGSGYDELRRVTVGLLRLSDKVCERAGLEAWQLGAEMPTEALPRRATAGLMLRRRHLRFSPEDLAALGVAIDDLMPFVFELKNRANLSEEPLGATSLERFPILRHGDNLFLVLPTAVTAAGRYFIVSKLEATGMKSALRRALSVSYSDLFGETALLGGARGARLKFEEKPDGAFAETMMQVDAGRFIHFLFYTDPLSDLSEGGLAGMNPGSMTIGAEFDSRIGAAHRSISARDGFRGGLTLAVHCGIGRGVAVMFGEQDWPGWRVEHCSGYDLTTLSWTRDFSPTSLWRILDSRDKISALGAHLQNINGLINLVAWAKDLDGHLVPHATMPDSFAFPGGMGMLLVDQNRQRNLRHESFTAYDPRVERFIDGRWIPVRKDSPSIFADDRAAPLYASEEPGESGYPMPAFRSEVRTWWADVSSPSGTPGDAAYQRWRTISIWLARAAPILDRISGLPDGPLLWKVSIEEAALEREPPPIPLTYTEARSTIRVRADAPSRTIFMHLQNGFDAAQYHPKNIAERALVAGLVHGVADLAGQTDPASFEDQLTPMIVQNDEARHGHALQAQGFRDRVRADLRGEVIRIEAEDDAYIRLNLGWSVRDRNKGPRLLGDEECRAFLNSLVRHVEDDILTDLALLNREGILRLLLRNHEVAIVDRDLWRRTSAAMIGLHGNNPDTIGTITDHDFKLNAIFQSTRILAEMAVCASPLHKGLRPGRMDLSLLMAKAALLVHVGGWSDAMRWGLMVPELRITPLGDVHANFEFVREILEPHGRVTGAKFVIDAADSYSSNFEVRPSEASVAHRMDAEFADAFEEQVGASIDQTRIFIEFVEELGLTAGKALLELKRSQLSGMKVAGQKLDDRIAARLIDLLSLAPRASWRDVPEGFEEKDRQPWRYRRRLSLLRRPLLQLDDEPDPTLLVAPGMLRDSFGYMLGNFHRGDFPDNQLSPKMKRWRARATGARGREFATEVAEALNLAGWQTRIEINVTALLGRGFQRDYGDVDVLAWNQTTKRVLIIECKDVQFRKTFGEIAEQLSDFRGEVRSSGRRDELRKHLDRMDVIREHLQAVSRYTGVAPLSDVESHLLFRHPVPMEFALKRLSERVTVSRFANIDTL